MGGRGARFGISDSGKEYGTEYSTLYVSGNIKFVRYNETKSSKAPMETRTKGRVYVTVNADDVPATISYYDKENKRVKQIDLLKRHNNLMPHIHHGYEHNENDGIKGATRLNSKEKAMVENVAKIWENRSKKK